mmetsp:Transcript_5157/g.11220  ORF Transcript_5157/g.11220 Transcript_5157/m.11220 type:complete len:898 (+) Transcript_5157:93-2786(+)
MRSGEEAVVSTTRCCPAPKRKRMRRIPLTRENTFVVFTAMVSHLAFVASSVVPAAEAAACFVSNSIASTGRQRDEIASKVTTTQDKLYSSTADGRSLRCRPISSTISPHLLHVPPPMRSTKDNASLYESSLKRIRNKRKGGNKKKSKELARHRQQPSSALSVSAHTSTRVQTNLNEGGKEMRFARSDRSQEAYASLSTSELQSVTNKFLATRRKAKEMNSSDLNLATRLLSSWGERKAKESGEMAEKVFNHILDEKAARNTMSIPSGAMLHTVLVAWINSRVRDGPKRALALLDKVEELHVDDETIPRPDTLCYVTLIKAFAKKKDFRSAQAAEELLMRLGQVPGNERQARHFNLVLNAYAESRHERSGVMAERLLERMAELYKTTGDDIVKPELQSYNTVIKAHAKSKRKDSAKRAANILASMEAVPDKISYSSCIDAWSRSGERGAALKAERLLKEMNVLSEDGHLDCKPDRLTYNAVIHAWAMSGEQDAGEKSEQLLYQMQKLYRAGDKEMQPDTWTYNTVIHAYANSSGRGAARKALKVLKRMEAIHIAGDPNVTPDAYSYNSAMNGLAKSREIGSAQMAEDLLERMESLSPAGRYIKNVRNVPPTALRNVQPDQISYNTAIFAWANSGDMRAAAKAEAILQKMISAYQAGDETLKPDVTTYNSLITAWSKTPSAGAASAAEELLDRMFQLYDDGDKECLPDRQSFTSVINAWAKSRDPSKAKNAQRLLRRMNALLEAGYENLRPNVYVYGAVLNACAFTYGRKGVKEEAFTIAIETFQELNKSPYVSSNDVTYATFMRAVTTLAEKDDPRRDRLIEHVFRQCRKDGQVSAAVLKQLTMGAPHLFISLMPSTLGKKAVYGMVSLEDVPREWMRNVRQGRRSRSSEQQFKRNTF